jgi:hypothetical protein
MDSPELRFLKTKHDIDKKFYAHATLEFAFVQATVAAISDLVRADIAKREGLTPAEINRVFFGKVAEYKKGFEDEALRFLKDSGIDVIETGSENN